MRQETIFRIKRLSEKAFSVNGETYPSMWDLHAQTETVRQALAGAPIAITRHSIRIIANLFRFLLNGTQIH